MKEIPLTQGKVAIVDDEDYEELSQFNWCAALQNHRFYAVRHPMRCRRGASQSTEPMHRRIMKAQPGQEVDHVNHDTLDNRRCNLRICTTAQNQWNQAKRRMPTTSKYKGVSWRVREGRWRAIIIHTELGYFKNEEDAARAYDAAAKKRFGEFAHLNFPND